MVLFSWQKIYKAAGGSSRGIVLAFRAHIFKKVRFKHDPVRFYLKLDFYGDSFILKPFDLLENAFKYTNLEISQYVALASLRNTGLYCENRTKTLDTIYSPVDVKSLNKNRLLLVKDGKIHFYYEESLKRRNKLWH